MRTLLRVLCAVVTTTGAMACKDKIPAGWTTCCGDAHQWSFCCNPVQCSPTGEGDRKTPEECEDQGYGETGIDSATGTEGASMTLGTGPEDATVDDSTGGVCEPTDGIYACHGWVAGVHQHTNGNTGFMIGSDRNAKCVGGLGETILITLPFMGDNYDNELGFEECKSECDRLVDDGMWGASEWGTPPSGWSYLRTACIFSPDGNNGTIPQGQLDAGLNGASELCSWVGKSGDPIDGSPVQIPYVEPADDTQCSPAVGCANWNPQSSSNITHSVSGTTHTTWMSTSFAQHVLDTLADEMYECDAGFFTGRLSSTGAEVWKMEDLQSSGELLYSMGFRSGDRELRIRRSNSTTWYPLNSRAAIFDAFDALHPLTGSSLVIEFKRGSGSTTTTRTMNLTIN